MQIAWDALASIHGGPLLIESSDPQAVSMAAGRFPSQWIGADSHFVLAGPLTRRLEQQINVAMRERFGEDAASDLLSSIAPLPRDGRRAIAFSMLKTRMLFEHAFESDDMNFGADDDKRMVVRSFGGKRDDKRSQPALDQVRIVWQTPFDEDDDDAAADEYIVELQTLAKGEHLILSRCASGTLRDAVIVTMNRFRSPNTKSFDAASWTRSLKEMKARAREAEGDARDLIQAEMKEVAMRGLLEKSQSDRLEDEETLDVPSISVAASARYEGLAGRVATPGQLASIDEALQTIRFSLDEKGASLQSEALGGGLFGGIEPRGFYFGAPFLILLVHEGSPLPYFAMWVGDPSVLEPLAEQPEFGSGLLPQD